ncbi:MAG: DEAD/DEAH box helicase family protein [Glaciimonas sp.]|nr:DEAD/DEAH box helicase family protein [Glaciimonas sp.]
MNVELLAAGLHRGFLDATTPSEDRFVPQLVRNDKALGKTVLSVVHRQLSGCEGFWFSVAFATKSGIAALLNVLQELEVKKVKGKVLVSQYQNFTQPEALRALRQFANIELRMATTGNFHAKGYLFSQGAGYNLLIGSSNLTAGALRVNKEWNLLVAGLNAGELIGDVRATFAQEFAAGVLVDGAFILAYEEVYQAQARLLSRAKSLVEQHAAISPNAMQVEALDSIARLRAAGERKALLISATGTGKTYLSAFDARQVMPKRLLFVVHRANIAKAAMRTFQRVFDKSRTMGMYSGEKKETEADFLFCTVQTLSQDHHLALFPPSYFLMLRTELTELMVHGFQANGIGLGFESKIPDAALELEDFGFGVSQHDGREMGGLRGQGFGGRFAHRGVLFEGLVVFFHTKILMRFSAVSGKSWSVGPGPGRCRC